MGWLGPWSRAATAWRSSPRTRPIGYRSSLEPAHARRPHNRTVLPRMITASTPYGPPATFSRRPAAGARRRVAIVDQPGHPLRRTRDSAATAAIRHRRMPSQRQRTVPKSGGRCPPHLAARRDGVGDPACDDCSNLLLSTLVGSRRSEARTPWSGRRQAVSCPPSPGSRRQGKEVGDVLRESIVDCDAFSGERMPRGRDAESAAGVPSHCTLHQAGVEGGGAECVGPVGDGWVPEHPSSHGGRSARELAERAFEVGPGSAPCCSAGMISSRSSSSCWPSGARRRRDPRHDGEDLRRAAVQVTGGAVDELELDLDAEARALGRVELDAHPVQYSLHAG